MYAHDQTQLQDNGADDKKACIFSLTWRIPHGKSGLVAMTSEHLRDASLLHLLLTSTLAACDCCRPRHARPVICWKKMAFPVETAGLE